MDHVDYIKENIARRETRLAEMDKERLTISAELGVFRDMLAKFNESTALVRMPPVVTIVKPPPSPSSFTMSPTWIVIFEALDARGRSFDASDVARIAENNNFRMTTPSIRSQFAHYSDGGYLRKVSRGKYSITQKGREKFAAAREALGESPKENGLPQGSPETGVSAPNFNLGSNGKENA